MAKYFLSPLLSTSLKLSFFMVCFLRKFYLAERKIRINAAIKFYQTIRSILGLFVAQLNAVTSSVNCYKFKNCFFGQHRSVLRINPRLGDFNPIKKRSWFDFQFSTPKSTHELVELFALLESKDDPARIFTVHDFQR